MALALGPGERQRWQNSHPYNPFAAPWVFHLESDAPAVAEGLFAGVMQEMVATIREVRKADLLLNDTYRPDEHDAFLAAFSWHDFTDEEWQACPPLLVVADQHSEQVDQLLRSDLPIRVVLLNAQRYDHARPVEPAVVAIGYGRAFVLQSTPAYPEHLVRGVEEGLDFRGPALFHLYAPDPAADGTAPEETADLAKLAVESRAFPLLVYDPRRGLELHDRLDLGANPALEQDWVLREVSVEMPNGLARKAEEVVLFADWAARQGRFFRHFTFVPKRGWHEQMLPLHAYLGLDPAERVRREPYVEVPGTTGKPVRKLVSGEMVAATEARLARWRLLLEVAGVRSTLAERLRQAARAEMEQQLLVATTEMAAQYDARLVEQEATHAERYHAVLTQQLLALSGFGEGSEEAKTALRALLEESTTTEGPHAGIS
jgi:pyruvate-ferredoxin/flavodoxin oxidoreductase